MNALLVFSGGHWLRFAGDAAVGENNTAERDGPPDDPASFDLVVGVVQGRDVTVRTLSLAGLSDAQAAAAARHALAETSIDATAFHVVVSRPDADGRRLAAGVASETMTLLLADWRAMGLDPDVVIPSPLLLPDPGDGFIRATIDGEAVLRGPDLAFADDPQLTPLLVGNLNVVQLDGVTLAQAIRASVADPVLNLRHGSFAKRRAHHVDAERLRRLAIMVLALGLLVLVTQIIAILRINQAASAVETATQQRAASVLAPGAIVTDPVLQATARLAEIEGPGGGFTPLATAVAAAIEATPGASLDKMVFDDTGGLAVTIRCGTVADLGTVVARLAAAGLVVTVGTPVSTQGRPSQDVTVRAS